MLRVNSEYGNTVMKGTKTSNSLSCFKAGSIERFCSIRVFFVKSSTSERSMTELNRTHSSIKHSIFFNSNIFLFVRFGSMAA